MKSMTGYGRASATLGHSTLTVQVSSVNRKTLDLTTKLPRELECFESLIGEAVRKDVARGKIHVVVELVGTSAGAEPDWDEAAADTMLKRLSDFASRRGLTFSPSPELLLTLLNANRREGAVLDAEKAESALSSALTEALNQFIAMRTREGSALQTDFLQRLDLMARHVEVIAKRAPLVPAGYRDALRKRLRDAGLELDLNDERVLKEIALFADRCDITEELTRLRSHFEQFRALLQSKGEIGRKAEFILQEIGREIHTIGSKANDLEIAQNVIELKNELERVREQIANVE